MAFRSPLSPLCALVLALPLLAGCEPTALPGEGGPELATHAGEVRIANSLSTQALLFNAISTNEVANRLVATNPLAAVFDPVSGDPYLNEQLQDVDAQHFMEYLVSCALREGESLDWSDPLDDGAVRQWEGKSGLCPEWATAVPSEVCLRRVSSCIVARNNAFGRKVELSLRGEDETDFAKFALEPVTLPAKYEPATSVSLVSLEACETPDGLPLRDCGWRTDALGVCKPLETVRLGAGGLAPDSCLTRRTLGSTHSGRAVLRVCEGLSACDGDGTGERLLAQSDGSCGFNAPAVTFTCPRSGNFNVMLADWSRMDDTEAEVGVQTGTVAATAYRLSEQTAFRFREGAFYGTLFDVSALAAKVWVERGVVHGKGQIVKGSVYRKMFSCYDPAWQHGAAYATHRVCALPTEQPQNCAATVVGPCRDVEGLHPVCARDDGTAVRKGDGDFEGCKDHTGTTWNEPVTVFLHGACDLAAAGLSDICRRLY
jgi:hypothetical protein